MELEGEEDYTEEYGPLTQGVCSWFNPAKGYGFIAPADGSAQIYVHSSGVVGPARKRTLRQGEPVEFVIGVQPDNQKLRAEHVTGPGGAPVQGAERSDPMERRMDPADGCWYTQADFIYEYGDSVAWENAAEDDGVISGATQPAVSAGIPFGVPQPRTAGVGLFGTAAAPALFGVAQEPGSI